jgi:hypothetical protein
MEIEFGEADIIMYDSRTGEELLRSKAIDTKQIAANYEDERKPVYELLLSGITSDGININIRKFTHNLEKLLVHPAFGKNHWLYDEVSRLTKIKNRTKSKRIKKKLEKRMMNLIFKEWLQSR